MKLSVLYFGGGAPYKSYIDPTIDPSKSVKMIVREFAVFLRGVKTPLQKGLTPLKITIRHIDPTIDPSNGNKS